MENTFKPIVTYYTVYPPIEVITTELDLSLEYRKEIVNEVKKISKPNNYLEGLKGSIVKPNLFFDTPNIFEHLIDQIKDRIGKVRVLSSDYHYELASMWAINYKKNDEFEFHNHLPSSISFCYYPEETEVPLIFNECDFKVYPKANTLIVFDSFLNHSSPINTTKSKIVISGTVNVIEQFKK